MMEETNIFPTKVFNTNLKHFTSDYEEVILKVKDSLNNNEMWKDNKIIHQTYDSELHKNGEYKILVDFFHKSLCQIQNRFEYDTENFQINLMWANKTYNGGMHTPHFHPNSFFSGIFYISSGSPTYFKDPNILKVSSAITVDSNQETENSFLGKPGDLLIFPSWLYHGTYTNNVDERITISFNSLPSGKTNYNTEKNIFSRMNIKSF